jgi:hypothetical protein
MKQFSPIVSATLCLTFLASCGNRPPCDYHSCESKAKGELIVDNDFAKSVDREPNRWYCREHLWPVKTTPTRSTKYDHRHFKELVRKIYKAQGVAYTEEGVAQLAKNMGEAHPWYGTTRDSYDWEAAESKQLKSRHCFFRSYIPGVPATPEEAAILSAFDVFPGSHAAICNQPATHQLFVIQLAQRKLYCAHHAFQGQELVSTYRSSGSGAIFTELPPQEREWPGVITGINLEAGKLLSEWVTKEKDANANPSQALEWANESIIPAAGQVTARANWHLVTLKLIEAGELLPEQAPWLAPSDTASYFLLDERGQQEWAAAQEIALRQEQSRELTGLLEAMNLSRALVAELSKELQDRCIRQLKESLSPLLEEAYALGQAKSRELQESGALGPLDDSRVRAQDLISAYEALLDARADFELGGSHVLAKKYGSTLDQAFADYQQAQEWIKDGATILLGDSDALRGLKASRSAFSVAGLRPSWELVSQQMFDAALAFPNIDLDVLPEREHSNHPALYPNYPLDTKGLEAECAKLLEQASSTINGALAKGTSPDTSKNILGYWKAVNIHRDLFFDAWSADLDASNSQLMTLSGQFGQIAERVQAFDEDTSDYIDHALKADSKRAVDFFLDFLKDSPSAPRLPVSRQDWPLISRVAHEASNAILFNAAPTTEAIREICTTRADRVAVEHLREWRRETRDKFFEYSTGIQADCEANPRQWEPARDVVIAAYAKLSRLVAALSTAESIDEQLKWPKEDASAQPYFKSLWTEVDGAYDAIMLSLSAAYDVAGIRLSQANLSSLQSNYAASTKEGGDRALDYWDVEHRDIYASRRDLGPLFRLSLLYPHKSSPTDSRAWCVLMRSKPSTLRHVPNSKAKCTSCGHRDCPLFWVTSIERWWSSTRNWGAGSPRGADLVTIDSGRGPWFGASTGQYGAQDLKVFQLPRTFGSRDS